LKYLLITFILLVTNFAYGEELTELNSSKVKALVSKNYCFGSYLNKKIYFLSDNKIELLSGKEFFNKNDCKDVVDQKIVFERIERTYKKNSVILITKGKTKYYLKNNKFRKINGKTLTKFENIKVKNQVKEIEDNSLRCIVCLFRTSLNFVSVNSKSQYSTEFSWTPRYSVSNHSSFLLSVGASSYFVENEEFNDEVTYALKYKLLYQYRYKQMYLEVGGGQHDFIFYKDSSSLVTVGSGYYFEKERYKIESLFFEFSKVDWRYDILEYKIGLGFSF